MPWYEHLFCLQGIFSPANCLSEGFSIMSNICVQIVHQEGLSKVVFIVWIRHRFEVEGHHGTWFDVSNFIHTRRGVCVNVEEFSRCCSIFGEVWVWSAFIPFLIVVDHMISGGREKLIQCWICEDAIKECNLVKSRFSSFVSDSC